MKCPECGQWNRASMPHCIRCGAPLNIDEASRVAWKDTLRDGAAPTAYLRADEFGQTDSTPDDRDTLARDMQKLKVRKSKGAELQQQMRDHVSGQDSRGVAVLEGNRDQAPSRSFALLRRSESDTASRQESEARHRVRFMDDTGSFIEARTYDPLVPDYPGSHRNETNHYRSLEPLLRRNTVDRYASGKKAHTDLLQTMSMTAKCGMT